MHWKYDLDYVPIELLRAAVAIVDAGSFTKAGNLMGLTQSAISAQVKRLQQRVGGDVFAKSGGGLTLTERGRTVERYARRILEMSEQLALLSGTRRAARLIRIGLPVSFAPRMLSAAFRACTAASEGAQIRLQCAGSEELLRQLDSGYLDIAMIVGVPPATGTQAAWEEPVAWVRSPDLHVSPGAPIPYISWPESGTDRAALGALEQAGVNYVVAFAGADFNARVTAAQAGLGYMLLPVRAMFEGVQFGGVQFEDVQFGGLQAAREFFLPPVAPARAGLCLRAGFDDELPASLLRALESVVRPAEPAQHKPVQHDAAFVAPGRSEPRLARATPRRAVRQSAHRAAQV